MNVTLDFDQALPRYCTADSIARMTGRTPKWVNATARRIAPPDLLLGKRQWGRMKTAKFLLLHRLQMLLDERSAVPFEMVKAAEPALQALIEHPEVGTVISHGDGLLRLVVSVPSLRELLTFAS